MPQDPWTISLNLNQERVVELRGPIWVWDISWSNYCKIDFLSFPIWINSSGRCYYIKLISVTFNICTVRSDDFMHYFILHNENGLNLKIKSDCYSRHHTHIKTISRIQTLLLICFLWFYIWVWLIVTVYKYPFKYLNRIFMHS